MLEMLYRVFFPLRCIGCKKTGIALCPNCEQAIPRAYPTEYLWIHSVYNYQHPLTKKIIKLAKYNHKSEALCALASYSAKKITPYIKTTQALPIVVIPVPQHKTKTSARGFNQVITIAQNIFTDASYTIDTKLLIKTRATPPQAHIHTRSLRLQNTKNSMCTTIKCDPNTLYVLIDDVLTTGGTLIEAHRALTQAGAMHIIAVTLAH